MGGDEKITAEFDGKTILEIFSNSTNHLKWSHLIEYVKKETTFNDTEKNDIIEAFQYLSNKLGKRFLLHAHKHHLELGDVFSNKAEWVLKWAVWFSESIKAICKEGHENLILDKLKSKNKYHEGIVFLELHTLLNNTGFKLSFDNQVNINGRIKRPDIRLTNLSTNEHVYLEITELNTSVEHTIGNRSFDIISHYLMSFRLTINYCGRVSNFDKSDSKAIIKKLEKAIKKAKENKVFVELSEWPFDIGIATTKESMVKLENWANKKQYKLNSLTGDTISFDGEIKRIKDKIQTKVKQLSPDNNNMIVIHVHKLLLIGVSYADLLIEIAQELSKYPKLFGVLIYGDFSWAKEENHLIFENHLISNMIFEDVYKKTFFLIRNYNHDSTLSIQSQEKIYSAFKFGKPIKHT